ncbi:MULTISPECIES: DUF1673 family protein [unclassified Methanoculleus]|jgi:hypothetical protein|uniref:DUF1673 family protein n=1 Tax=unclassified Methanoculleus TaxID=2619537 RepID=UPI0025D5811D|nr:DUF1673 family protein [Methanoculleus sp. UBA377]
MIIFVEYLRKKLGWCPNAAAAGIDRKRYAVPDGKIETAAREGSREMAEGVFVDYVSPWFLPISILVFGGLFVAGLLIPALRPGFSILMGLSFMTYAAVHLYHDTKGTVIESSENSVIVRRSRSRPLAFGKDAFRSVVMIKAYPPVLRRAFALLLVLTYAGVFFVRAGVGWMRYPDAQAVDPEFVFQVFFEVGFAVFMLELLYRSLVSLRYPGHLRVRLEPAGFLHVYTDDPKRLAVLFGAPR